MKLGALNNSVDRLIDAPPVAVTLLSTDPSHIEAVLLLDSRIGSSGTKVVLQQARGAGGISLDEIIKGGARNDKDIPASGAGAVLVFEAGTLKDGVLTVGRLATRVHDGHQDLLQVGYILARPSRISVSKRGAIQSATITDPSVATMVRTKDDFESFVYEHLGKEWPGGRFGLIMRTRSECVDILRDEDDKSQEDLKSFIHRLIVDNDVLGDGPIELIPCWNLPMGQEQMARELDVRTETKARVGRFGSLYGQSQTAFMPSLVLITNDDEWAFKNKTGRRPRTIVGMHPLNTSLKLKSRELPSPEITGSKMVPPKWLYKNSIAMEQALSERQRRAAHHHPASPVSKPATTAGRGRPLSSLGGLGRR